MGKLKSYLFDNALLEDRDEFLEPDFDVVDHADNTENHQSTSQSSHSLIKTNEVEEEMPF